MRLGWLPASKGAVLVLLLAVAGGCGAGDDKAAAASADSGAGASLPPIEWRHHGNTADEQRYSRADSVNTSNVSRLGLAWFADFDTHRGQEATPLMVDGVLYVSTAWSKVYAFDAVTGKVRWKYDPEVPGGTGIKACCDAVNRGVAYDDGRIFLGALDGRLIALDAKSGRELWSTRTLDPNQPQTITGAPRAARGKVYIGNGGAEYGVRGFVSAYDAATGKLVWRFYTVPGDPSGPADGAASDSVLREKALPTWHGTEWVKFGGGGTVWDAIVYDEAQDQLLVGTGNGSPWNRQERSQGQGDNLFLSSIIALDPDTGAYRWHYQETPGETWDYTATQQITLTELGIDGQVTPVLLHAPKNGFFYVIDRRDGRLVSAEKFAPVNWAERIDIETGRPVETAGARFEDAPFVSTSGGAGAHNWHAMSFSPQTGFVYIPVMQVPFVYTAIPDFEYRPGEWNLGVDLLGTPLPLDAEARRQIVAGLQGRLIAWDPVAQKEAWRVEHRAPWNGGTLATAGGLVFQGTVDHDFRAFDAADGRELWRFATQDAVIAAPISYAIDGIQYIAVAVGNGGGMPLTLPTFDGPKSTPNGRLMVFTLDGKAELPAFEVPRKTIVSIEGSLDTAQSRQAFELYGRYCAACHGIETLSAGVLPDLRYSAFAADPAAWRSVVIDGALEAKGMVGFGGKLTADDTELIRRYVGDQARRVAAAP
jgi:PQQ-dependent dehydrogenase (methanol/ethanol family)